MRRLALLAAVAAVLGGCSGTPPTPAPSSAARTAAPASTGATDSPEVAALLARPLRLPTLAPGADCPRSPVTSHSPVVQPADEKGLGTAPLYPISFYANDGGLRLGDQTVGPDGLYEIKVVWASIGGHQGVALVRAGRIDAPGRAAVKLYYAKEASRGDAVIFPLLEGPGDYPSATSVSGPGCYVWQIDGEGYSETVYFQVTK
jgi:hypothetical protein